MDNANSAHILNGIYISMAHARTIGFVIISNLCQSKCDLDSRTCACFLTEIIKGSTHAQGGTR